MLTWVNFALGVVVAVLLLALCRVRYGGNLRATVGGVVGTLGATCAFSLVLAQITDFHPATSLILIGVPAAGAAALGGFLYAEVRRVRGIKGTPPIAEDIQIE